LKTHFNTTNQSSQHFFSKNLSLYRLGIGPGRSEEDRNTEEEVNDYLGRAIDARSIDRLRYDFFDVSCENAFPLRNINRKMLTWKIIYI